MKRDDRPALGLRESYVDLLAEHCFTATPAAIGMGWVEWFAFAARLRDRPKAVAVKPPALSFGRLQAQVKRTPPPTGGECARLMRAAEPHTPTPNELIEFELNEPQREALARARAYGMTYVLGRDPNGAPFVYFPKGIP